MRCFAALVPLILLLVSGCGGGMSARQATPAEVQARRGEASAPPRLQPGEKIRVIVYGENSLSGDYQIDPSGFLSLPLAGTIKAAGLTQKDLEGELARQFSSGYLRNPRVTVSILEFRPFYIAGEVEKPGMYPYSSGLDIMSAVAIAGGATYRANQSTALIRQAGEGEMKAYDVNPSAPISILPGDIIQIPRRYF